MRLPPADWDFCSLVGRWVVEQAVSWTWMGVEVKDVFSVVAVVAITADEYNAGAREAKWVVGRERVGCLAEWMRQAAHPSRHPSHYLSLPLLLLRPARARLLSARPFPSSIVHSPLQGSWPVSRPALEPRQQGVQVERYRRGLYTYSLHPGMAPGRSSSAGSCPPVCLTLPSHSPVSYLINTRTAIKHTRARTRDTITT